MVKPKRSSKHPQANHKSKGSSSQFDKRARLSTRNAQPKKTLSAKFPLVGPVATLVNSIAFMLDGRTAFRLSVIMADMMLCDDRRVPAAWFATVGVQDDWDRFYDCLIGVLRDSPAEPKPKQRGRPRKYGPNCISLRKRAAHRDGWESNTYRSRGGEVIRKVESFLATSRVVGGVMPGWKPIQRRSR